MFCVRLSPDVVCFEVLASGVSLTPLALCSAARDPSAEVEQRPEQPAGVVIIEMYGARGLVSNPGMHDCSDCNQSNVLIGNKAPLDLILFLYGADRGATQRVLSNF